jgi:fumarylacetoacetase
VAIGDEIVDLAAAARAGVFEGLAQSALQAASEPTLNRLMAMGPNAWSALRLALSRALREGATQAQAWQGFLLPQAAAEFRVPAQVGDYTDFYTSIHHATTVGRLFRPDDPLLPNYKWVPIGYHGRASSLGVSGQTFRRPRGQVLLNGGQTPTLEPSRRMDYELEMGIFIGGGNEAGSPISIEDADRHVFGFCLLNDWSARDIQSWEYQPLGPFLSKNFATTLSPWIVTAEALAPYRGPWRRDPQDPQPLPYLDSAANREAGAFDIRLEVRLETERMRANGEATSRLSQTSFRHAYWTVAQLVAHHTVNGCNLQPGDLFGSGTLSGPGDEEAGSLLELTRGGKQTITLTNGESRTFLEDGDAVILRGWCERAGAARIGFGESRGTLLAA